MALVNQLQRSYSQDALGHDMASLKHHETLSDPRDGTAQQHIPDACARCASGGPHGWTVGTESPDRLGELDGSLHIVHVSTCVPSCRVSKLPRARQTQTYSLARGTSMPRSMASRLALKRSSTFLWPVGGRLYVRPCERCLQ